MKFMVVDQHGVEIPDCIIVKTKYGGFDIYETSEDYASGMEISQKSQRYCELVMRFG
jgi:hypothetical protein